jgi:hypothetical protein
MSAVQNTCNNYHSVSIQPPVKGPGKLAFHTSEIIIMQGQQANNEVMTKRRILSNATNSHFSRKQKRIKFKESDKHFHDKCNSVYQSHVSIRFQTLSTQNDPEQKKIIMKNTASV